MGKITFARVDSRLIHGQIVTKWAKSSGANTIYIIDDAVRSDDFSMDIYMASGKRYGFREGIQHSGSTGSLGSQSIRCR